MNDYWEFYHNSPPPPPLSLALVKTNMRLIKTIERKQERLDAWLNKMASMPDISLIIVERQRIKAQKQINELKKRL